MPNAPGFWARPVAEVLAALQTTPEGLDAAEAARRRVTFGPNAVGRPRSRGILRSLAAQFATPMVLMLMVAAAISFGVGSPHDALIILGIIVLSGVLGFWQEFRAGTAVAALQAIVAVRARVCRGAVVTEEPIEDLVPGDVVELQAGSVVPADALLLAAKDLHVDEATLTGETFPAEKRDGVISAADAPLAERAAALFQGTHVVSGLARAVVVHTGATTELGRIAGSLGHRPPVTDFEHGVQRFGYLLMRVTAVLVLAVFAVNVGLDRPVLDSFLFALALAVGLVPELLPAIVGITLAQGARRMAKQHVIVKRLAVIENFGAMTVLCCDKTGTLTEGQVCLEGALGVDGEPSAEVLRWAAANAAFETGLKNPIDEALRATQAPEAGFTKLDEVPYDFVRKRLSVLVAAGPRAVLTTKGALTAVLAVCATARVGGATVPLAQARAEIERRFEAFSAAGLRTLGVAIRDLGAATTATRADERDLEFLGFLTFLDPPRAGIEDTLDALRTLGIRLAIVTGDNARVAATVARRVGLATPVVMTGAELRVTSEEALRRRVTAVNVFAEIEPNQKERIIRALRRAGEVVGYLGDGINDAPALHAADVGMSVARAVDVAREAAEIVFLEPDLRVIVAGVREGRMTFANTLKYVHITTSANFGNMLSMAGAAAFLPFLPLLPKQILLLSFLSDFPAMAIAGDHVDPELLDRPQRWDTRRIRNFMLLFGGLSSVFDYLTFGLLRLLGAGAREFQSAWFLESLLTELLILLVIRTKRRAWRSRPSRGMALAVAGVTAVAFLFLYLPIAPSFGFVPLAPTLLATLAAIAVAYVIAAELAKRWWR